MTRINPNIITPAVQALKSYAKTQPAQRTEPVGRIAPAPARPSTDPSRLVAAKVDPINLATDIAPISGPKPMITSAGTYSINPSAGDRNAAATGVRLGRSLDLRG